MACALLEWLGGAGGAAIAGEGGAGLAGGFPGRARGVFC